MPTDAREEAWGEFRDGPDYQPTDRYAVRPVFDAGFDAGVAAERERCARIAEDTHAYRGSVEQWAAREIAAAIRADREPEPATEAPRWEYAAGYEADNGFGLSWFSMDAGGFVVREAAEREVERYADSQIRLIRRRVAGPWEPAPAVEEGLS